VIVEADQLIAVEAMQFEGKLTGTDLSVTKSDASDPVAAGDTLTYTLRATNNGPNEATGVVLTDTLPVSVTYSSASPSQGTCSESDGTVSCDLGTLSVDGSAEVTLFVTPQAAGTVINTVSIVGDEPDHNASNNTSTEETEVIASADLSIAKSDSADPVSVGEILTYTLVVANDGPSDATGVILTDTLPVSMTLGFAMANQGTCSGEAIVTCAIGALSSGDSATVTLMVTPTAQGVLINTANVAGNEFDPDTSNNFITEDTSVDVVDLSVSKLESSDPVNIGAALIYTVTVTNKGPSDATNVTITDTLTGEGDWGAILPSQGSCGGMSPVVCDLESLASADSVTITMVVTPTAKGVLTNTVRVSSDDIDPNPDNNEDVVSTEVIAVADLAVTKTGSLDSVKVGEIVIYTVTVANNGPNNATHVVLTDTLTGEGDWGTILPSQGSCSETDPVVCDLGELAAGDRITITMVVTPTAHGVLTNTARVGGEEEDLALDNNEAVESTQVTPVADLIVAKVDSSDPVKMGETVVYTVTVTNDGPSNATGVILTDTLAGEGDFGLIQSSQGSCSETDPVVCDLGELAVGDRITITMVVTPTTHGILTNTVSLSAREFDPYSDNNVAIETTLVTKSHHQIYLPLVVRKQ
jgi:uncharacterized repeat protein (TIGR01451 family)